MTQQQDNHLRVVADHFREASAIWSNRYQTRPTCMSDLDLQLRRESVRELVNPLMKDAPRVLRVLDLGCGTADTWTGFPREAIEVYGLDLVEEMVASAARAHPEGNYMAGDAAQPPLRAGSMDIITCLGVLEYVPAPQDVLQAIRRLLSPGGSLVVSFPNRSSPFRTLSRLEVRAEGAMCRLLNRLRGRSSAHHERPAYKHRQWTLNEATVVLQEEGFLVEKVRLNTFGVWGQLGRLSISLRMSAWMSHSFSTPDKLLGRQGCTMVFLARAQSLLGHGSSGESRDARPVLPPEESHAGVCDEASGH